LTLFVKNAWLEKKWAYGVQSSETIIEEAYQLIIETREDNLKGYYKTWMIGINGDHYIRTCGKSCLMSDFAHLPDSVITWAIQNGNKLDTLSPKKLIGEFVIHKK
jgi:hypothetical protein